MKRGWLALVVLVTAAVCSLAVSCSKPVLGCDYRLTVTWQERKSVTEPIPLTTAKVYAFFVNPDEWEVTSIENARAGIATAVGDPSRTRSYDMVAEASGRKRFRPEVRHHAGHAAGGGYGISHVGYGQRQCRRRIGEHVCDDKVHPARLERGGG